MVAERWQRNLMNLPENMEEEPEDEDATDDDDESLPDLDDDPYVINDPLEGTYSVLFLFHLN